MRYATRALVAALLMAAAMLGATGTSAADPFATPSIDPISDDFNPHSWLVAWNRVEDQENFDAVANGDVHAGMDKTGMTVSSQPAQWSALTAADRTQLTTAWDDGLLAKTWTRGQQQTTAANRNNFTAIPWANADSDAVARDLGASSYSALSPGLKSVVQRIATIVTGEYKPAMPDDAWASWMPADVRAAFDARPDKLFDYRSVTISATTPPGGIITQCDAGIINWACIATNAVVDTIVEAATWATDPLGKLTAVLAEGASGLMAWIADAASDSTAPDLTADWWINAYTVGMGIGVLLLGFVLLWQLIQKARGAIDSRDLVESFLVWGPAYFGGIVFGPPLAQFMIVGSGYLTDGIVASLTGYSAADASAEVTAALDGAAAGQVVGSAIMALIILLFIILAAFMVFISLSIQTVAVYLSSAVFAVAFAWVVSTRHRGGSLKIPMMFLGMMFSRPLLFFLLGVGLAITRQVTTMDADTPGKNLAMLVMAVVVLTLAGFAPLLLLKYAPVMPTGTGGGGSAGGGVAAAGIGAAAAAGGSKLAGMANARAAHRAAKGASASGSGGARSGSTTKVAAAGGGAVSGAAGGAASTAAASAMSRAAKPGSVAQRLNRAPRSTGGTPSARGASLGAKVPSPAPAASAGGSGAAGSAGGSARSAAPAPAGPVTPRSGSRPAAPAATQRRRLGSSGRPAGGHVSAAARNVTEGLDGDQKWDSR